MGKTLEEKVADLHVDFAAQHVAQIAFLKNMTSGLEEISESIDKNFETLNNRISDLEKKVSSLHDSTDKGFDDVKFELVKIQEITKYKEAFANLQVVNKK